MFLPVVPHLTYLLFTTYKMSLLTNLIFMMQLACRTGIITK